MNTVGISCRLLLVGTMMMFRWHSGHITHDRVLLHSQGAIVSLLLVAFVYHYSLCWFSSQRFLINFSSVRVAHAIAHQVWDAYRWFRRAEKLLLIHIGRSDTERCNRLVGGIERLKLERGIPYLLTSLDDRIKWQSFLWRIIRIYGSHVRQYLFLYARVKTLRRPFVRIHLIFSSLGIACASDRIWLLDAFEDARFGTLLLVGIVPKNCGTLSTLLLWTIMHHRHLVCETSHLAIAVSTIDLYN